MVIYFLFCFTLRLSISLKSPFLYYQALHYCTNCYNNSVIMQFRHSSRSHIQFYREKLKNEQSVYVPLIICGSDTIIFFIHVNRDEIYPSTTYDDSITTPSLEEFFHSTNKEHQTRHSKYQEYSSMIVAN